MNKKYLLNEEPKLPSRRILVAENKRLRSLVDELKKEIEIVPEVVRNTWKRIREEGLEVK